MSVTLTTQILEQGGAEFLARLSFDLTGYTGSYLGQTWAVKIVCPDGRILSKTTGLVFDADTPQISVPIDDFDISEAGIYYYQVTLTTGGANAHSKVSSFLVEGSLPEGLAISITSSAMNYFPIFSSGGTLDQSNLRVDVDTDLNYSAGGAKFNGHVTVLDDPFGVGWNGNLEVPTKNAVYDYLSTFTGGGGGGTSYTEGSVPFADSTGSLIEDNSHFFYNPDDGKLMLWNINYRNFQGANAIIAIGDLHPRYNGDTYRDVGLETFDFGSGPVPIGKYFIDVEPTVTIHNNVTTSGVFVFMHGRAADSSGILVGVRSGVSSYGNKLGVYNGNMSLTGVVGQTYLQSQNETDASGGIFFVFTGGNSGGVNTTPLTGVHGYVQGGHNGTTSYAVGGNFYVSPAGGGGDNVFTYAAAVRAAIKGYPYGVGIFAGVTAVGLDLSGWTPNFDGGTWDTGYGIYADDSIYGTTRYFIYSTCTAPSIFSGSIAVPDDAYDATAWNGNLTVPTKNAVRDKIEALSLASGTPGGSDTYVQFNDGGAFGGSSGLTYDKTLSNLVVGNSVNAGGATPAANVYFNASSIGVVPNGTVGSKVTLTKTGGTTGTIIGFRSDVSLNATMTNFNMHGGNFNVSTDTTGSVTPVLTSAFGLVTNITNVAGATITNATGVYSAPANSGTGTTWKGFYVQFTNSGTLSTVYLVQPQLNANIGAGATIGNVMGIALTGWGSNTGTITNSYGIYADTSIDKGTTKYFIYSLSTSPSVFSGTVTVPDDAYDATSWDGNFTVPTKNAIRDKIESLSSAGLSIGQTITSATPGSVLYAGTSGVLAQDNANFFYDDTLHNLKVGGSVNAGGTTPFANIYFFASISGPLASGTNGFNATLTKTGGASGTITGHRANVALNATMTNSNMIGGNFTVSTDTTGSVVPVLSNAYGSQYNVVNVAGATITNATALYAAMSNQGAGTTWKGLLAQFTQSVSGSAIPSVYLIHSQLNVNLLGSITTLYGLAISSWGSNTGTITTSYGIYADDTISKGTTSYFIYSLSTAPSLFSGTVNMVGPSGGPAFTARATVQYDDIFRLLDHTGTARAKCYIDGNNGPNFYGPPTWSFADSGNLYFQIRGNDYSSTLSSVLVKTVVAGKVGMTIQLAASQSGNAFEVLPDGSATPLLLITSSGALEVPDDAYNTSAWDGNFTVPTKNAIRDKIEAVSIESFIIAVSDEVSTLTTGTAKVTFRMPYAFTLTAVRATVSVASSSGNPTIDIKESGTTIFSTLLSIDSSEKTSTTAATPAVISDASLADDAEMTVDVTVAGTGTKGLKLYLVGHKT